METTPLADTVLMLAIINEAAAMEQTDELLNPLVLTAGSWIAEYQVIQERLDLFRIMIISRRPATRDETAQLRAVLQGVVGCAVHLRIEDVSAIPSEANGKFHFCRSLVEKSK